MSTWIAIAATAFGCYAVKLLGLSVPAGFLERPLVRRLAALLPIALLAALTALQTFGEGRTLVLDARGAGLAAAAVALVLRAPFLVVVAVAVVVTGSLRAVTG
ncbi:AzlD domain-containing protein [Streptomyces sp. NPDC088354]|uniref:AzlD domain-containing protein n=1 Tax=unclassified Streptomyces TaxID=2593676 RepID=UPI0029A019FA|nr:AzlD domain-containing protein [Streptomyces sp. MI02-7b]MDX3072528.1 AzlD domain-containing protein [Streptomyces sp. MI02-7b]